MFNQGDKIIRWGIPGWILLSWVIILYAITHPDELLNFVSNEAFKSLGITAILASVGVPIGYIIHEVYFALFWTVKKVNLSLVIEKVDNLPEPSGWDDMKDKEKFYYIEFLWDKSINQQKELELHSIKERYRERLTLIHSLGTLIVSLFLSFLITIIWCPLNWRTIFILVPQIIIFSVIFINYKYHSKNLLHYQGYYLNDLLKRNSAFNRGDE